jgi:hypothetical protein
MLRIGFQASLRAEALCKDTEEILPRINSFTPYNSQ